MSEEVKVDDLCGRHMGRFVTLRGETVAESTTDWIVRGKLISVTHQAALVAGEDGPAVLSVDVESARELVNVTLDREVWIRVDDRR